MKLLEPVDVDKIEIKRDHYFANAYIIDLPLNSTPDHVWQDIFEREWKSSRHLWDRKLFVVGSNIRLVTPPSSMQEKLDWLKKVVKHTNERIDVYNREAESRAAQIEEEIKRKIIEEEKANVEMIKDLLRRRFGAL
ncbi:MAG: hypothetical protein ACLFU9_00585 [Candidatus Bathyarchaeia archaeon]